MHLRDLYIKHLSVIPNSSFGLLNSTRRQTANRKLQSWPSVGIIEKPIRFRTQAETFPAALSRKCSDELRCRLRATRLCNTTTVYW